MNKSIFEDYIKQIEAHDFVVIPCSSIPTKTRAIVCYFFSRRVISYEIYIMNINKDFKKNKFVAVDKQLSPSDLETISDCSKDNSILIISDYEDRNLLEHDLFRAKVEYQIDNSIFITKQDKSNYISSLKEKYNSIIKYRRPGGPLMWLYSLRHYASEEEYFGIPSDINVNRFLELYDTIAIPLQNNKKNNKQTSNNTSLRGFVEAVAIQNDKSSNIQNINELVNFCDILKSETGIDFVFCTAGNFLMGSPDNELGRIDEYGHDEKQIAVTIEKPFFIAKYLITDIQYVSYADEYLMSKYNSNKNNYNYGDTRAAYLYPIIDLSYNDSLYFCELLNKKFANILPDNYNFSLPTESQWEYACRAGTTTAFNNGKNITESVEESEKMIDEIAWAVNCNIYRHIVVLKKQNNWELYDMHGNLYEWCINDQNRKNSKEEMFDAIGKGGSCFFRNIACCRSAAWLGFIGKDVDYPYVGFRLALVPIS